MSKIDFNQRLKFFRDITYRYNLIFPTDYLYLSPKKEWGLEQMMNLWRFNLRNVNNPYVSLYLHIPFCLERRCSYCINLSSVLESGSQLEQYLDYLKKTMLNYRKIFPTTKFNTLYIGGGTPSILSPKQLDDFLKTIKINFKFESSGMKTIEMSPATASYEKIDICKRQGINRISMGIQSLNCKILESVNRFNTLAYNELQDLCRYVNRKKFEDFNLDLIIGLPGENNKSFLNNLTQLLKLNIPSITVYKYVHKYFESEKNTPKYYEEQYLIKYKDIIKNIGAILKKYHYIEETSGAGINNLFRFVKKNHSKKQDYFLQWNSQLNNSVLGIGKGSTSLIQNKVFANEDFNVSVNNLVSSNVKYSGHIFNKDDQIRNYTIMELWRNRAMDFSEFKRLFGLDFYSYFKGELDYLRIQNKVIITDKYVEIKFNDILDFAINIKLFFNFSYLKTNYQT